MKVKLSTRLLAVICSVNLGLVSACDSKLERGVPIRIPEKLDNLLLSSVVDSIRYIQLETRSGYLIGSATKIVCFENRIYILDRDISKTIFVFDNTGRFLFQLGKKGRGPGEFTRPTDFVIDPVTRKIILLDQDLVKICFYDFDGAFLKELRLGFAPFYISVLNESTLAFYLGYLPFRRGNSMVRSNLVVTDTGGNIKGTFFPYETEQDPFRYYAHTTFYNSESRTLFIPPLEHSVYLVTRSEVVPLYSIEFGRESLPSDFIWSKKPKHELVDELRVYRHSIHNFFESSRWIYFSFFDKKEVASCFYSKVSGAVKVASVVADDIDGGFYAMPVGRWGEELVGLLESVYLTKLKERTEDRKTLKIGQNLKKFLEKIDDTSNPLLIFYRLKTF
jgi:hypothetical protein